MPSFLSQLLVEGMIHAMLRADWMDDDSAKASSQTKLIVLTVRLRELVDIKSKNGHNAKLI
jgi:hypothetical protein